MAPTSSPPQFYQVPAKFFPCKFTQTLDCQPPLLGEIGDSLNKNNFVTKLWLQPQPFGPESSSVYPLVNDLIP